MKYATALTTFGLAASYAAALGSSAFAAPVQSLEAPYCTPKMLALRTDDANGTFTGMMHAGTYLYIHNVTGGACAIAGLPPLALLDKGGTIVATGRPSGARFMHPGPVVMPILLKPDATAVTALRWVSGNAFDHGVKAEGVKLSVTVNGGNVTVPYVATMWSGSAPVTFDEGHVTLDLPSGAASPSPTP